MIKRTLPAAGGMALALGLILAIVGIVLYGTSMTTNLLAGTSDLLIGIAAAILVIDRITRANLKHQWSAAYQALHGLFAATFVDVMRLLYVQSSAEAYAANASRYQDAIDLAGLHVSSLRSTLEGFSSTIEPGTYAMCRKVEQRLSWMITRLSKLSAIGVMDRAQLQLMDSTGAILEDFIMEEKDRRYVAAVRVAELALVTAGVNKDLKPGFASQEIWRCRFECQEYILRQSNFALLSQGTIMGDIDNELALYYFALDQKLLNLLTAH